MPVVSTQFDTMASITIHRLDDRLTRRLTVRAAEHGRSVEDEARAILEGALEPAAAPTLGLGRTFHALFGSLGGVDLRLAPREPMREPPRFD